MKKEDSEAYVAKKKFFDNLITLYGRKTVLEALHTPDLEIVALHLSQSNKTNSDIEAMQALAKKRNIPIKTHTKAALSRISKNSKQDQGVALDIKSQNYQNFQDYTLPQKGRFIALDGIHNPQNLGMIIRSVAASRMDAIILPKNNTAKLSPLVMKASAGTLFKAKILFCTSIESIMDDFKKADYSRYILSSHAKESIFEETIAQRALFILGNETEGVSQAVQAHANKLCKIPMQNGVESLNVAVTAALIAFLT